MNFSRRLDSVESYYFSRKLKEVKILQDEGKPIINMGIGSPDMSPPPSAVKALQQAVLETYAHQYQGYHGLPELREAFSNFYKLHYGVILDSNSEILPLMGSKEGIMHISMAFLDAGDEVLIPSPGYPTYTSVTKIVEAIPKYYELSNSNDWLPNLEHLGQMDLSKVKLMWINYPHMPTGVKMNFSGFEALVKFAKRHQILLVNDNPYSFILNDKPLSILKVDGAKDIAIELNSLSKAFNMSGWRVGVVLGQKSYIAAILKIKSNMDSGMFYPIQKGAIEALKCSNQWFAKMNERYSHRRELIYQLADKLNCEYNRTSCGLFVWAKLPKGSITADKFVDNLLYKKYIFITPGHIFSDKFNDYVRFSLCVDESQIKEAISRF